MTFDLYKEILDDLEKNNSIPFTNEELIEIQSSLNFTDDDMYNSVCTFLSKENECPITNQLNDHPL